MMDWLTNINTFFSDLGVIGVILGAVIGWLLNWRISKNRINADLKAKTRLEWIKEVRKLTSEIISLHHDFILLRKGFSSSTNNDKINQQLISTYIEISKKRHLYLLYFSKIKFDKNTKSYIENEENITMRNNINEFVTEVSTFVNTQAKDDKNLLEDLTPKYNKFKDETSDYLKKEWDKAKSNQ